MVIYCTVNLKNGKKYVGLDTHNDPKYLGSGVLLKRAVKKYGPENFNKVILDIAKDYNELVIKEDYWITKFNALKRDDFYNLFNYGFNGNGSNSEMREKAAKNRIGLKRSKETKKLMSESAKATWENGREQKKAYKWEVTFPDNTTKVIINMAKFCEDNNLNKSHMNSVANGNRSHHKGYICRRAS